MIVAQVWTGNAYRNFNYLVACSETGEALAIEGIREGAREALGPTDTQRMGNEENPGAGARPHHTGASSSASRSSFADERISR